MGPGRPTKYTVKVANIICQGLIGGKSLPSICKPDKMPSKTTVYNWLAAATREDCEPEFKEFLDRYTQARQLQPDALIDECLDIADDRSADWMTKNDKNGNPYEVVNREIVQRSKLRVDTRIILAERLAPKKYRPQSAVDHTVTAPPKIVDDIGGQSECPPSE